MWGLFGGFRHSRHASKDSIFILGFSLKRQFRSHLFFSIHHTPEHPHSRYCFRSSKPSSFLLRPYCEYYDFFFNVLCSGHGRHSRIFMFIHWGMCVMSVAYRQIYTYARQHAVEKKKRLRSPLVSSAPPRPFSPH